MIGKNYNEQIYSGVLGKIIGVYIGRPVEGWPYEKIRDNFNEIYYYKNHLTGAPLIVPDDDISGTFAFYRALEDNGYTKDITAKQIGDAWLNYIIEKKTILWWGGLSRSTEHTAYLRLKNGINAPKSGSIQMNGKSMAEQIGAEIFIDTWAMVNPVNPELAVKMAKEAASVSHDGIAIEAACYLTAMESMAFEEKNIDVLLDRGQDYITDKTLIKLIKDIRSQCAQTGDWRKVRQWIAENHGYEKYPGNCPMVTNHLVILMALIMGGEDFQRSIMIASSAGWDTDCNSGNVGCLNGIRLGLRGIDRGADFRKAVADRMYIVTSDGGSCITDAVRETRKIISAYSALAAKPCDIPRARYAFEYFGSTQGFVPYEGCVVEQVMTTLCNAYEYKGESGLFMGYKGLANGTRAVASVDTFVDTECKGKSGTSYFEVLASPTLYATQTIRAVIKAYDEVNPSLRFFVDYFNQNEDIETLFGERISLKPDNNDLIWQVPDTKGHVIYRLGIELTSDIRLDGGIVIKEIDWSGAPQNFVIGKSMDLMPSLTPWTTQTTWLKSFVSSAENFYPDYVTTFSISHPVDNGVVTTGTRDWIDYSVRSRITFSQQNAAGLVARANGHRRYYAAVFKNGCAVICKRINDTVIDLATAEYLYQIDKTYDLKFTIQGNRLSMFVDGCMIVTCCDDGFKSGGAGFVVDQGAILADTFTVTRI